MPRKDTDGDNQQVERQHVGRRKLIQALGVGGTGVVVSQWAKPVVDSVVVPLHAQASPMFSLTCVGNPTEWVGCAQSAR